MKRKKIVSIGVLAKIVGVTPEAIRYYEKRNVLSSSSIGSNGYRYYDRSSLSGLFKAKFFQSVGFQLNSTFFKNSQGYERDVWIQKLNEHIDYLQSEINTMMASIGILQNRIDAIRNLDTLSRTFNLVDASEHYFCPFSNEFDEIECDDAHIAAICECVSSLPCARYGFTCTINEMLKDRKRSRIKRGFILSKDDAVRLNFNLDATYQRLPAQQYLQTVVYHERSGPTIDMEFGAVLQYAKDHRLKIDGTSYGKWIIDTGGKDYHDMKFYYELWVPVTPI